MMARAALPAVGDLSNWTAEDVMYFGPALAGLTREELYRLCPVLGAAAQSARDLLYDAQKAAFLQCSGNG